MKRFYENLRAVHGLYCAALLPVLALAFTTGCIGCKGQHAEKVAGNNGSSIAIMTWNVQELFDGVDDGIEYDEYRESAGWNQEKYRGRLNAIASAIGGMERKPDIIAIQEVESAQATEDLAACLSAHGYRWTHFAHIPGMALGVGILSRFPLSGAKSHSVMVNGELAPRPMLEVRLNFTEDEGASSLALFVCHWKSKLGGENKTESTRRASARAVIRILREFMETEPGLPAIIMGDLNENYNEFYRRSGAAITALLPDDPRAAEFAGMYSLDDDSPDIAEIIKSKQKDFIILSKNKPPAARYFPDGVITLYSPWNAELENGSYYYKNDWETIDHFLLSPQLFTGSGWNFETCTVVNYPPFASAKGLPMSYNSRTGSGMSDHLPLLLFLKLHEAE